MLELMLYWAFVVHEMNHPSDPGCPDAPELWETTDLWMREEL